MVGLPIVTESLIPKGLSSVEIDIEVKEQLQTSTALYSINMPVMQALAPDIIVTQALCGVCAVAEKEVLQAVSELPGNPEVINLESMSLNNMFETMLMVGGATKVKSQARNVVDTLKQCVEVIRNNIEKFIPISVRQPVAFLKWLYPNYLKMPFHSTPIFIHSVVVPLYRGQPCASSRLALNKNRRTLNSAFSSSLGIDPLFNAGHLN